MIRRLAGMAAVTLSLFMTTGQAQEMPRELNFGIISTESSQNLKKDWEPFLADMEKRVGTKINAFFASDYAGIIEAMRFNKVQVAWFGNKAAMEAVDRANGEIFVQVVSTDGTLGYYSFIGARKDSPYQSLDDILKHSKAVTFGIGDPNSTSGFLVPNYYAFAQNGVDPRTAFKSVRSANHETNILALANRQVDASVFSSDTWERIEKNRPEVAGQLKLIWKSPMIPSDPMVWRRDLNPEMKKRLKDFFLAYAKSDSREREIARKITFAGFVDSSNAQLKPIRQLELFKEKTKIAGDAAMAAPERQQKLAEIDRKLAELK